MFGGTMIPVPATVLDTCQYGHLAKGAISRACGLGPVTGHASRQPAVETRLRFARLGCDRNLDLAQTPREKLLVER